MSCDCCGQPKNFAYVRRPNYQKLVEIARPVYHTTLIKRPSPPKPHTRVRQPCAALAATRSGVKYVLPMDCEKYLSKPEMTSMKPERKKCCYDTGNKHDYYPKAEIPSGKLDVKRCDNDIGKKIVICLPRDKELAECCKKPCDAKKLPIENVRIFLPDERPLKKPKPTVKDYMYRCESRELIGSKLLKYCECVKRNGLQDRCPRTACGGRPACLVKPWPDCWPSGGCSGIDYSRPNGAQRVNPTLEYRRDVKECIPPWEQTPEIRVVLQEYT